MFRRHLSQDRQKALCIRRSCDPAFTDYLLAVMSCPYKFLFAPSSHRIVEPDSDTLAKSPWAREQDNIAAFITASVSAEVSRPFGPAAAEASAHNFTLLDMTSSRLPHS